jgi:hypothetical protein
MQQNKTKKVVNYYRDKLFTTSDMVNFTLVGVGLGVMITGILIIVMHVAFALLDIAIRVVKDIAPIIINHYVNGGLKCQ